MCETARLTFIEQRDGLEGAIAFAKQTIKTYRTCVLHSRKHGKTSNHYASVSEYKRTFIESYLSFKAFLEKNNVYMRDLCSL